MIYAEALLVLLPSSCCSGQCESGCECEYVCRAYVLVLILRLSPKPIELIRRNASISKCNLRRSFWHTNTQKYVAQFDKVGHKTIKSQRYMEYTMNGKLAFYFFVEVNSALKHIRKCIPSNRNVINYVDTRLLASI